VRREPLPRVIYRAHPTGVDPLEPSIKSGAYRWDDFRPEGERRFHMLYTADAVESCFAEKLQAFACGDDEAHAILASIVEDEPDAVALPPRNVVGARVLRELAASTLEVLDQAFVVDPFDVSTLRALPELARRLGVDASRKPSRAATSPAPATTCRGASLLSSTRRPATWASSRDRPSTIRASGSHELQPLPADAGGGIRPARFAPADGNKDGYPSIHR
jgi:hypothetical protein